MSTIKLKTMCLIRNTQVSKEIPGSSKYFTPKGVEWCMASEAVMANLAIKANLKNGNLSVVEGDLPLSASIALGVKSAKVAAGPTPTPKVEKVVTPEPVKEVVTPEPTITPEPVVAPEVAETELVIEPVKEATNTTKRKSRKTKKEDNAASE